MNVGELKELLALLPDDVEIHIWSSTHHGPCHVTEVRRNLQSNGHSASLSFQGRVNWQAPAPQVTRQGRWPKKPPAAPTPVDKEKVTAGLLALLKGNS